VKHFEHKSANKRNTKCNRPGQLSLAILLWVSGMSTSESWGVNRHTAQCTSSVSVVSHRHGHGLGQSMGWVGLDVFILFYRDFTKITGWTEVDDHSPLAKKLKECQGSQSQRIQYQTDATHAIQPGVLSSDQTSYRGCTRDHSGNSSCHKTACNSILNYSLWSADAACPENRPMTAALVCTHDTKSSSCNTLQSVTVRFIAGLTSTVQFTISADTMEQFLLWKYYQLDIRSVERGICPIAALCLLRLWPFGVMLRHRLRDHYTRNR